MQIHYVLHPLMNFWTQKKWALGDLQWAPRGEVWFFGPWGVFWCTHPEDHFPFQMGWFVGSREPLISHFVFFQDLTKKPWKIWPWPFTNSFCLGVSLWGVWGSLVFRQYVGKIVECGYNICNTDIIQKKHAAFWGPHSTNSLATLGVGLGGMEEHRMGWPLRGHLV